MLKDLPRGSFSFSSITWNIYSKFWARTNFNENYDTINTDSSKTDDKRKETDCCSSYSIFKMLSNFNKQHILLIILFALLSFYYISSRNWLKNHKHFITSLLAFQPVYFEARQDYLRHFKNQKLNMTKIIMIWRWKFLKEEKISVVLLVNTYRWSMMLSQEVIQILKKC